HINGAGLVQGFGNGIALVDTNRSFVMDVEVKSNEGSGVLLATPTGGGRTTTQNAVHRVNSHNNSDGIRVESGASATTIPSCEVSNNSDLGIALKSDNNWIASNLCSNNSDEIQVAGASGNFLLGNRCLSSGTPSSDGIDIVGASNNNRVWQNDCNSGRIGIAIAAASTGNDLFGNTCSSNSLDGIAIGANTNTVRRNTTDSNGLNGIRVEAGATGNTLTGNTALNNVSTLNVFDDNFPCANTWNNNTFGSAANRGGAGATCIS